MYRYIFVVCTLVLSSILLVSAVASSGDGVGTSEPTALKTASGEPVPTGLVQALQQAQHAIEADGETQFKAFNRANGQRIQFNDNGVQITPSGSESDWQWGLKLTGYGTTDDIAPVAAATRTATGQRIEFQRGPITEWYENRFIGLEQGFTLSEAPAANTDNIVIELAIEGGLEPRWLEEGQALAFHQVDGSYALTYNSLVVLDATQRELPAHLALVENTLQIHVDVADASWPIVVDPLVVNEQKVTAQASDGTDYDRFGGSVSLYGDTALIGADGDDNLGAGAGSAYVFVRSGDGWTQQAHLTATDDGAEADAFGIAVALYANTALVGAYYDDDDGDNSGSAYVFFWNGTSWSQQAKLTAGTDGAANDVFGWSVDLSGDSALIGARGDDDNGGGSGSAYVFTRSGTTWSLQQKFSPTDGVPNGKFGSSVALVGDNALIGASADTENGSASGSAYVFTRSAAVWSEQDKLLASDGAPSDAFGYSVALSGDTALIGARLNTDFGNATGSAYVFTRSGDVWTEQAKLLASDAASGDQFGISVGLVGDIALVGAQYDDDLGSDSGAAYVFTRSGSTWTEQVKLLASDGAGIDKFGGALAMSGDTALVGSLMSNDLGSWSGAAYVFNVNEFGQWGQQSKLLALKMDAAANDHFGWAVAVSGDVALVGAHLDDDNESDSGSVYSYTRSGATWSQQQKLTASDGQEGDQFGQRIAIYGNTALIGAFADDDLGTISGSAYVFTRAGSVWTQRAKLTASDGAAGDVFGYAVALSGDTALIGAHHDDDSSGSAYVFTGSGTTWTQQAKLTASDGAAGDYFGLAVALHGDTALIGAYGNADHGFQSGSAYVFTRDGTTWSQQAKLTASNASINGNFGNSVALFGETALVGASGGAGQAYIFTRSGSTWSQRARLTGTSTAAFGASSALSGNTALIGSFIDDGAAGSAYIFTGSGSTWVQRAKLTATDRSGGDEYGRFVALSGDTALIGARGNDDNGSISGSAYFYTFPCSFGHNIETGQWSMIAAPCSPATPGTVTSTFGDDLAMASYGVNARWILYERNASAETYMPLAAGDPVDPGVGLWIKSFDAGTLDFEGTPTPMLGSPHCPSDNGCFVVDLTSPGSGGDPRPNMVGHPLPYDVDLTDVRVLIDNTTVYTLADAQTANLVSKTFQWWSGSSYSAFDDVTPGMGGKMEAFKSCWIKVLNGAWDKDVKLLIPATPSVQTSQLKKDLPWYAQLVDWLIPSAQAANDRTKGADKLKAHQALHAAANKGGSDKTPAEWYVRLVVTQDTLGLKDSNSVFGQLSDSTAGHDSHDLEEKAPFGDTWLTVLFPHPEWGDQSADYASDFHALPGKKSEDDSWTFEIRSDDPGRVLNLRWQGPADILERSTLIDTMNGTEVPAINGYYQFDMNGQTRSFEWVLGKEAGAGKGKKK